MPATAEVQPISRIRRSIAIAAGVILAIDTLALGYGVDHERDIKVAAASSHPSESALGTCAIQAALPHLEQLKPCPPKQPSPFEGLPTTTSSSTTTTLRVAQEHASRSGKRPVIVKQTPPPVTTNKAELLTEAGIAESDWKYADFIIMREGKYNPCLINGGAVDCTYAVNKGPRAYGVCQAKPGNKMASAGEDWATNPVTQLKWCDSYAQGKGGWEASYNLWKRQGWW